MNKFRILVLNPKSTSTDFAIYENEVPIFEYTVTHDKEILRSFSTITSQYIYRTEMLMECLIEQGINPSKMNAVCGRGGLLSPIEGGTYKVNKEMLEELMTGVGGEHPSNLGAIMASEVANGLNISAYIVDPVVVDELEDIARISGYPSIKRRSVFHALNHKACGRRAAMELGKSYQELNFIIAHLGEGITIGAHKKGKVVDVNNGLNGEGPFSQQRAGSLPHGDIVDLCYSGQFTYKEMKDQLLYHSGITGYLHSERKDHNISQKEFIYDALAYQIAKEIGSCSTVLFGLVDAIVLTGDLAYNHSFMEKIMTRVDWIADIFVYPGENDLQSLAYGCLRVLRKEENMKIYEKRL